MNESSDIILRKDFIRQCEDLTADIIDLSVDLNEDKININEDINRLIVVINGMKIYKDEMNLSDNIKNELNKVFDQAKKDFINLKNKHIAIYNEKVEYINERIKIISTKLNKEIVSQTVKKLVDKLETVKKCDTFVEGNWDQNAYLKDLEYDKLDNMYNIVSEIEKKLKINVDVPLELFSSSKYIEKEIKKIEKEIEKELLISDINTNLEKCITLLERVTNLDIQHELMREKLSKDMFGHYCEKIKGLRKNIKIIEDKLLDKKSVIVKKTNYYAEIFNKLEQISKKYDMLNDKILEYVDKCTPKTACVFKDYLNYLSKNLLEVQKEIKKYDNEFLLNQEQKDNLYRMLNSIADKHKNIKIKALEEPTIIKEEEKNNFIIDKIILFDKELDELEKKINKIDGIITDKNIRNELNKEILDKKEKLDIYEKLLSYYKVLETDKYEEVKNNVDKLKNKFENINDKYTSKCPLRVKSVRNIKKLYQNHHKLGLISAGLSSLALLGSINALIPAIMYGNIVASANIPALKGMMNLFNKILGGVNGMTLTNYGVWKMASGTILNASTATTSILKSLATFGVGVATLLSPTFVPQIITKVKDLVNKIKKYELKEKITKKYDDSKDYVNKKVNEVKTNVDKKKEEKNLKQYYENLYHEYRNNKLTLEEFCEKKELSERDIKILHLMDEEEKLKIARKEALNGILNEYLGRRKK